MASEQSPSSPLRPTTSTQRPNGQQSRRLSFTHDYFSSPSPRSPPLSSLQAAAQINAGLLQHGSSNASPVRQRLDRRRSSLMTNLIINDPSVPAPGEMQQSNGSNSNSSSPRIGRRSIAYATADPNHHRQPSLGEIHQELENEQEAQVNRLLQMIRLQHEQIATIQRQQAHPEETSPTSTAQTPLPTPPSTLSTPGTNVESLWSHASPNGLPHSSHSYSTRPRTLSRQASAARATTPGVHGHEHSPSLTHVSGSIGPLNEDFLLGGTRDECAFYQAETHNLIRENQMLKMRIRELERQVAEMSISTTQSNAGIGGLLPHSPHQNSPLASPPATSDLDTVAAGATR